jgi:hypothetical protein
MDLAGAPAAGASRLTLTPLAPPLAAVRVLRAERRGSSLPVIVETPEGVYFVKLRGAAQAPATLVAEVLVAAIAEVLGLPVPAQRVITFASDLPSDDRNDELADLLRASAGENLGFTYLDGAVPLRPDELALVPHDFASQVVWLDWLVSNPDRSARNPNILRQKRKFWLVDHGAALPFQHDWAAVTEAAPVRPPPPVPHLLLSRATELHQWDPILTALVSREVLLAAAARVPDSFLLPLLPEGAPPGVLARRRGAYAAFLWKRLQGEHVFHGPAAGALPGRSP